MSSQEESWHCIKEGNIYLHTENDGYRFMRRGPEAEDKFIMTVEEAKRKNVYQKLIKDHEDFYVNTGKRY